MTEAKRILCKQFLDVQDSINFRLCVLWNLQRNKTLHCQTQVALKWPFTTIQQTSSDQSTVLLCGEDSLVGLCTQDYKSLCAAANITTHTQTSRQRDRQTSRLHQWQAGIISLYSWTTNQDFIICIKHLQQQFHCTIFTHCNHLVKCFLQQ